MTKTEMKKVERKEWRRLLNRVQNDWSVSYMCQMLYTFMACRPKHAKIFAVMDGKIMDAIHGMRRKNFQFNGMDPDPDILIPGSRHLIYHKMLRIAFITRMLHELDSRP